MTKLVSFVVFTAGFIWTWFLFHSSPIISIDVHAGLQSRLTDLIAETIQKARPQSYNFKMLGLSTETIDENKISARFSYSYFDQAEDRERTRQTVTGEAVLNRAATESEDEQKWVIQSVKTNQSEIEFQQGLVIGPNPSNEVSDPTTPPADTQPIEESTTAPATPSPETATEVKKTE